jgi:hypothetical protein
MPWSGGVYTRGYPSWSNDAANNLPISATKFDTEDNDFATGLNNCLTRDGLVSPTNTITWAQTASQVLQLNRGSDGTICTFARTGGSHNPSLQINNADATGITLNLTTGQTLALAISGTNVATYTSTTTTIAQPTTFSSTLTVSGALTASVGSTLTGQVAIGAPPSGTALTITGQGTANVSQWQATGNTTNGNVTLSFDINGFPSLYNQTANTTWYLGGFAAGTQLNLVTANSSRLNITAAGNSTFYAPTSGVAVTIQGLSNSYAATVQSGATASQGFGLQVWGGTNASDVAFGVFSQTGANGRLGVYGDGQIVIQETVGYSNATVVSGANTLHQAGYMDEPQNAIVASYQLQMTDRGKCIYTTTVGLTLTIPANSGGATPVPFPTGTIIRVVTLIGGANQLNINITTDTLYWLPSGASGNRILGPTAACTLEKMAPTVWVISGAGIS